MTQVEYDDAAFRERVRRRAGELGVGVREVCAGAGVAVDYLYKPSASRHLPVVDRMARLLGCHPAWLLYGEGAAE